MASSLLFSTGELAGRRFLLPADRAVVIGSGPLSDLTVPATLCEPVHCVVLPGKEPRSQVLVDAWTRTGTRVNGSLVEKATVRDGDVVEAGGCRFQVVPAEENDPPAPATDRSEPSLYSVLLETDETTAVGCEGVLVVGRAPSADLCLDDDFVSWHHCLLATLGSERLPLLLDLRSRNGTWVNGRLVRKAFVTPGAAVQVGHSVLRFRLSAAQGGARPSGGRPAAKRPTTAVVSEAGRTLGHEPLRPEEDDYTTEVIFGPDQSEAPRAVVERASDYLEFFGFQERPFALTPDPDLFFPAPSYSRAIVALQRWFEGDRPVGLVIGGAGCGKTTLLGYFARQLRYYQPRAVVVQPGVECGKPAELVATIADATRALCPSIQCSPAGGMAEWSELVGGLSRERLRVALLMDDADTPDRPLVQDLHRLLGVRGAEGVCRILLAGRRPPEGVPAAEGAEVVASLGPLSPGEVAGYLGHRVRVVSGLVGSVFAPDAAELIAERSRGVPRLINNLADLALFAAFKAGHRKVAVEHVEEAVRRALG